MNRAVCQSKDPDILASMAALRRAARAALRKGIETGTPVWVMKNGRMIDLARETRRHKTAR
jgi:hypothetical protein